MRPGIKTDQRRSPRYRHVLEVELREGKESRTLKSRDVSRHGIFLETESPPRERFLVQLTMRLPTGILPATAFVSRTVAAGKRQTAGVGLQFFALSAHAKRRWDAFIHDLSAQTDSAPSALPPSIDLNPDVATFLIKLRNSQRLLDFYDRNFLTGSLYMATPLLKETGADVALAVIHPSTEVEYTLRGRVARVCQDTPKGMEIQLLDRADGVRVAFREFVTTGEAPPRAKPPTPKIAPTPSVTRSPSPLPPKKVEEEDPSEDISIDIVVDEAALQGSEQFSWSDVSPSEEVITFDLVDDDIEDSMTVDVTASQSIDTPRVGEDGKESTDSQDLVRADELAKVADQNGDGPSSRADGQTLDVPVGAGLSTSDMIIAGLPPIDPNTAEFGTYDILSAAASEPRAAPEVAMTEYGLTCSSCGADHGIFRFGPARAPLGILAVHRPYWCPGEARITDALRVIPKDHRIAAAAELGPILDENMVSLRDLFSMAELVGAPRCESCQGALRSNGLIKSLSAIMADLGDEDGASVPKTKCPSCSAKGALNVIRRDS